MNMSVRIFIRRACDTTCSYLANFVHASREISVEDAHEMGNHDNGINKASTIRRRQESEKREKQYRNSHEENLKKVDDTHTKERAHSSKHHQTTDYLNTSPH